MESLDFSKEIELNPALKDYIKRECDLYELEYEDPLKHPEAPKLDTNFSSYFLLCGLPKVEEAKCDKLKQVLVKIFTNKNVDYVHEDDIKMLVDKSTGKTYGTGFIKCEDEQKAKFASAAIHNFVMTKTNTIMSSTFDEFERLIKISDEYHEPKFADLIDLYSYAMDEANDQFMMRESNQIYVKMNRIPNKSEVNVDAMDKHETLVGPGKAVSIATKSNAYWSQHGRYLVVFQKDNVQLYGGSGFDLVREIIHTGVSAATVSPCERYIITYSSTADAEEGNYKFWQIDTGEFKRSFAFDEYTTKESGPNVFSFSYDGNYCAKLITDHVVVYELPGMEMLIDESLNRRVGIRIDGIQSFQWSPSKSMFAYWMKNTKKETLPPKIGFVNIPNRKTIAEREINNGYELKFEWSADGTKLISMNKLKRKKEYMNSIAIFDLNSQSVPIEMINSDYNILSAKWVSNTKRLALLIDRSVKIDEKWKEVSTNSICCIYDIVEEKGSLKSKFIGQTKEHISNIVDWAKNGNIFIVADTKNRNPAYQGVFNIYYIRTMITKIEKPSNVKEEGGKGKAKKKAKPQFEEVREYLIDLLTTIEDSHAETISWDPTSRFFITGKLQKLITSAAQCKFKIHDLKGDTLFSYSSQKLQQFAWRPRPVRNYDEATEKAFKKELKKNLKKKIVDQDESSKNEIFEIVKIEREHKRKELLEIIGPLQDRYRDTKKERRALIKQTYDDSDSDNYEEFDRFVVMDIIKK